MNPVARRGRLASVRCLPERYPPCEAVWPKWKSGVRAEAMPRMREALTRIAEIIRNTTRRLVARVGLFALVTL